MPPAANPAEYVAMVSHEALRSLDCGGASWSSEHDVSLRIAISRELFPWWCADGEVGSRGPVFGGALGSCVIHPCALRHRKCL